MLLFGMINWMFTWMKSDGALTHEAMAPIVADLFLGGLSAVRMGRSVRFDRRGRDAPVGGRWRRASGAAD